MPNLGCRRAKSLGWFDVSPKNSPGIMMHEWAHCCDEAANHQFSTAVAFWIIWRGSAEFLKWFNFFCRMNLQNLMQIHCSTHSVILNPMVTQYTCSVNCVYHPYWLVEWCHHCSHMCIPLRSPGLPGCINVTQITFIILSMVALFLDRPHRLCS